jgi:hypothetical protein
MVPLAIGGEDAPNAPEGVGLDDLNINGISPGNAAESMFTLTMKVQQ